MNRRGFIKYGLRGFAAAVVGKGFYNSTSSQLELVRRDVEIKNLAPQLHGLKIGLLTDLHASYIVSDSLIRTAGEMIMGEQPDLIALTGDYISGATKFFSTSIGEFDNRHLLNCVNALSGLMAPLGIYGVLGNHDFWSGQACVKAICETFSEKIGVVWLRNSSVELNRSGALLNVLGVDDYWERSCSFPTAIRGTKPDTLKILLSHNPDINAAIDIARKKIDLVLSGHTHGGQVALPFFGQPVTPSEFGQKYRAGLVIDGDRKTYISRGVGCLLAPVRLNSLPEATILTLKQI